MDLELLGARIRQAREWAGLSQEDLAALISRDQRAISEYENGKRKLAAADLPLFAKALDVSLLYFYEGELSEQDLDRSLLDEFHQIPTPEARKAVIDVVRILVSAFGFQPE